MISTDLGMSLNQSKRTTHVDLYRILAVIYLRYEMIHVSDHLLEWKRESLSFIIS